MATQNGVQLLRALPTQVIESDGSIRLRRGCVELRISGERAAALVDRVFSLTLDRHASAEDICEQFAAPDRRAVLDLLGELEKRRILVPADDPAVAVDDEGPLEVFYWHFGESAEVVLDRLGEQRIGVVGVNVVGRELVRCLAAAGIDDVELIDDPMLRNVRLYAGRGELDGGGWPEATKPVAADDWNPEGVGCLVATSDFGGRARMRQWNAVCLEQRRHFLPVVLQDLIGFVGPLVVPGETACFECATARWNSNLDGAESRWELLGFDGQAVVAFHPAMATALGALAAFELTKFYGIRLPFTVVGRLIELNLLTMQASSRKVFKIPRCPACSPLNDRATASLTKSWFGFAQSEE